MKNQTLIADIYTDQPLNIPEKGEKIGDLKFNYPDYNVVVNFYTSKTKVNTYKVVSKPILVVGHPSFNNIPPTEKDLENFRDRITSQTNNEYNVIVINNSSSNNLTFSALYEADQTPIDYKGLEKIINNNLK